MKFELTYVDRLVAVYVTAFLTESRMSFFAIFELALNIILRESS